jgi:hypothetical protein
MTDDQPSITESDWIDTDAPAEGQLVQVRARRSPFLRAVICRHLPRWRMVERRDGRTSGLLYRRVAAKRKRFDRPKIEFIAENGGAAGVRLRKGRTG